MSNDCKCECHAPRPAGQLRQTHTTVHLDLPMEMHAYVKQRLLDAGYHHAIDGSTIHMQGISLVPQV